MDHSTFERGGVCVILLCTRDFFSLLNIWKYFFQQWLHALIFWVQSKLPTLPQKFNGSCLIRCTEQHYESQVSLSCHKMRRAWDYINLCEAWELWKWQVLFLAAFQTKCLSALLGYKSDSGAFLLWRHCFQLECSNLLGKMSHLFHIVLMLRTEAKCTLEQEIKHWH